MRGCLSGGGAALNTAFLLRSLQLSAIYNDTAAYERDHVEVRAPLPFRLPPLPPTRCRSLPLNPWLRADEQGVSVQIVDMMETWRERHRENYESMQNKLKKYYLDSEIVSYVPVEGLWQRSARPTLGFRV